MEKPHLSTTLFSTLNLHESLKEALEDMEFSHCTPIQAQTLPFLLNGRDLTGQAQTGTGKSAAFLLAILNHLMITPIEDNLKGPFAIVLAPTRELALQIYKDATSLGRYTGLKYCAVYGGTGYDSQRKQLDAGVDVIIGTPGRIIDFFKQGVFTLKNIEVLVLDEADRMFDLGFVNDIRYLLHKMPAPGQRLNMLFSATFSQRVLELAYEHMNNPEKVIVESDNVTADRITQHLFHVASHDKIKLLFGIYHKEKPTRSIVFVNTKRVADEVAAYLEANDIKAAVLSGDIPQNKRERLLEAFKHGVLSIMVATDVAARGLHIPDVSHVFNYDLPQDAEDYVHRIGRTARAGADGTAISFACEEYVWSLQDIEDYIGQSIPIAEISDDLLFEPIVPKFIPRERRSNESHSRRTGHPAMRNHPRPRN
ncbi:ATP-dependent RNA helicase [Gammaproteobacteria bacterium]|nr:ATP-dependent RNA helicase [Gammaproteobacteria bacterium]